MRWITSTRTGALADKFILRWIWKTTNSNCLLERKLIVFVQSCRLWLVCWWLCCVLGGCCGAVEIAVVVGAGSAPKGRPAARFRFGLLTMQVCVTVLSSFRTSVVQGQEIARSTNSVLGRLKPVCGKTSQFCFGINNCPRTQQREARLPETRVMATEWKPNDLVEVFSKKSNSCEWCSWTGRQGTPLGDLER